MVDIDTELSLAQLNALVTIPGALKIITAEHACGIPPVRGEAMPTHPKHQAICQEFGETHRDALDRPIDTTNAAHFVQHKVTKIEQTPTGSVRASSDEGDWTEGPATALLRRLQEWRT
jgi:hypothetical protein